MLLGLFGLILATLQPSSQQGQLAVVAPPWFTPAETVTLVRSAGARITRTSGTENIVIVQSDDPDFVPSLYDAGAWLVVDPLGLSGCGDEPAPQTRAEIA